LSIALLLQHIANHTRNGGPAYLRLERFIEALSDSSSGLTYPAVIGSCKQPVIDAERLFSASAFMQKKGYETEAKYIETVCNWRRAGDECGLSSLVLDTTIKC